MRKLASAFYIFILVLFFCRGNISAAPTPELQEFVNAYKNNFVKVMFHFKNDPENLKSQRTYNRNVDFFNYYIQMKKSLDLTGIIVDDSGFVWIHDLILKEKNIDKIVLENIEGETVTAEIHGFFKNAPIMILKPERKFKVKIDGLNFKKISDSMNLKNIFALKYELAKDKWLMSGSYLRSVLWVRDNKIINAYASPARDYTWKFNNIFILSDTAFNPVGITSNQYIDGEQALVKWQASDFLSENIIIYDEWNKLKLKIEEEFGSKFYKIKISFRQKKQSAGNEYSAQYYTDDDGYQSNSNISKLKEIIIYGIAIDGKRLFVPFQVNQEIAKKIEKIEIFNGNKIINADFDGAFNEFNGFIVSADENNFENYISEKEISLFSYNDIFFQVTVEHLMNEKKVTVEYNRFDNSTVKKFGNLMNIVTADFVKTSAFGISLDGRLCFVNIAMRDQERERERFSSQNYNNYSTAGDFQNLYPANILLPTLLAPAKYLDKKIKTVEEDEENRKLWIGVEYEPLTFELAKNMQIEKLTKDGKLGLLISMIYTRSPAEKLGLKSGDILLKVKENENAEWTELKTKPLRNYSGYFDFPDNDGENIMYDSRNKPWRPQKNYLNQLLETFGEGVELELVYYNGDTEIQTKFVVEQAPPDFDCAKKFRNKQIGLTVKEITYEVRAALKIAEADSGVVIEKIESGTPAALARLSAFDVITKIDGSPVLSVDDFEVKIQAAIAENKENITLVIMRKGKSRIADLKLKQ